VSTKEWSDPTPIYRWIARGAFLTSKSEKCFVGFAIDSSLETWLPSQQSGNTICNKHFLGSKTTLSIIYAKLRSKGSKIRNP
jgi:hypothetical protein